jgi:DNA gyrase subunit A
VYALLEGADRGDRIVSMIAVDDLAAENRFLVFLSRQGVMKRTPLEDFSNPRAGGIKAAGVKGGDSVMDVGLSDGTAEIMLLSRGGRAIRFAEEQVSVVGRTAQGVKGMALKGDDEIAGMLLLRRDATVLTVSEDGLGKRTPVSEFPLQNRGGMGTLAVTGAAAKTPIVCALEVVEADEVMIVTAAGRVTRASLAKLARPCPIVLSSKPTRRRSARYCSTLACRLTRALMSHSRATAARRRTARHGPPWRRSSRCSATGGAARRPLP